jgi:hypothetical protein
MSTPLTLYAPARALLGNQALGCGGHDMKLTLLALLGVFVSPGCSSSGGGYGATGESQRAAMAEVQPACTCKCKDSSGNELSAIPEETDKDFTLREGDGEHWTSQADCDKKNDAMPKLTCTGYAQHAQVTGTLSGCKFSYKAQDKN